MAKEKAKTAKPVTRGECTKNGVRMVCLPGSDIAAELCSATNV